MEPEGAAEVQRLALTFRARAAEAEDGIYRRLLLRTATELEARADQLRNGIAAVPDGEPDSIP